MLHILNREVGELGNYVDGTGECVDRLRGRVLVMETAVSPEELRPFRIGEIGICQRDWRQTRLCLSQQASVCSVAFIVVECLIRRAQAEPPRAAASLLRDSLLELPPQLRCLSLDHHLGRRGQ